MSDFNGIIEFFDSDKASSPIVSEINALSEDKLKEITGLDNWDDLEKFRNAWIEWVQGNSGYFRDVMFSLNDFCEKYNLYISGNYKIETEDIRTKLFGEKWR